MELRVVQDWLMSEFNIEITKSFTITKDDLVKSGNSILYNKNVKIHLGNKGIQGVYVWSRIDNDEIIYVGMSGKLIWKDKTKTEVEPNSYNIQKRLVSSRGRHKVEVQTEKVELTTYRYLKEIVLKEEKIRNLKVSVFEVDTNKYSPTYIESCILQEIFSKYRLIPKYNESF